jgi:hypothetical protein
LTPTTTANSFKNKKRRSQRDCFSSFLFFKLRVCPRIHGFQKNNRMPRRNT